MPRYPDGEAELKLQATARGLAPTGGSRRGLQTPGEALRPASQKERGCLQHPFIDKQSQIAERKTEGEQGRGDRQRSRKEEEEDVMNNFVQTGYYTAKPDR